MPTGASDGLKEGGIFMINMTCVVLAGGTLPVGACVPKVYFDNFEQHSRGEFKTIWPCCLGVDLDTAVRWDGVYVSSLRDYTHSIHT